MLCRFVLVVQHAQPSKAVYKILWSAHPSLYNSLAAPVQFLPPLFEAVVQLVAVYSPHW